MREREVGWCGVPMDSPCIPLGTSIEPDIRKPTSLSVWASVGWWTTQLDLTELTGSEDITKQDAEYSQLTNWLMHGKIHEKCHIFSPESLGLFDLVLV